ncbi:MAG TPA: choice-of-anchor D domain-containing protein [Bacteroidota bacterium]|nr:choice-of-anchor D domain-containing protein [Bacteroidota bacterium]
MSLWYRVLILSISSLASFHIVTAQVVERISSELKFVRGQLTFLVSTPGTLRWDIGGKSDYLPLILTVRSLSGSARVSITVVDVDSAPIKGDGLPPEILRQYYRIVAGSGLRSFTGHATITYSEDDLASAGGIVPSSLQVYQRQGERWVPLRTISHDVERHAMTVEVSGLSDLVIGGPAYSFEPRTLNFGTLKARLVKRDSIVLRGLTLDAVTIDSARITNTRFAIQQGPTSEDGREAWLYVDFRPEEDQSEEGLLIVHRRGSVIPDTLIVRGVGRAPVFVPPSPVLIFEDTKLRRRSTGRIDIANAGSDTLVVSARSTDPSFALSPTILTVAPMSFSSFVVSFSPRAIGEHEGEIEFTHNAPGSRAVILATGVGKAPLFSVSTREVSFGNVQTRTTVAGRIDIRNSGNDSLTIQRVFSPQPWISVGGGNVVVPPGDTASFSVVVRAGEIAGVRSGWVVFEHNAQSSPDSVGVEAIVTEPIEEDVHLVPGEFFLSNNYPNPFNPVTTIEYGIVEEALVTLRVYTMLGVEVRTLVNGFQSPGFYSVTWDAKNDRGQEVATGMYFYRLEAHVQKEGEKPFVQVRKMLFVK